VGREVPRRLRLRSSGDDPQTPEISVAIRGFSRPVLRFEVALREQPSLTTVFVTHLKSKLPARVDREEWFTDDPDTFKPHATALGSAMSTIRRTAEATALRVLLTGVMKGTVTPVIVLGDLNDGQHSNVHEDLRESLDHILVSEQFYDNSERRLWLFDGLVINNDHLNDADHRKDGTGDHGIVRVAFRYRPAPSRR
jgi:hypothetical protein